MRSAGEGSRRRRGRFDTAASAALLPMTAIFLIVYVAGMAWSFALSLTPSRLIPVYTYIGFEKYAELLEDGRAVIAAKNVLIFGPLVIGLSLVLGFGLAILIDQRVRFEGAFRSLFLYPYATSFIVTGFLWRWIFSPSYGLERFVQEIGFTDFRFDWLVNPDFVIYTLVVAFTWHAAGLVMALALAGLRGIDNEIWNALRVDGIPSWRSYVSVILPMLRGTVATCVVLLAISVIKVYDLVVAMTQGGPNFASQMPGNVVMSYMFERSNVAIAMAGVVMMLMGVVAILAPWFYLRRVKGGAA
jgi:glucose/mannose transport system permease protein